TIRAAARDSRIDTLQRLERLYWRVRPKSNVRTLIDLQADVVSPAAAFPPEAIRRRIIRRGVYRLHRRNDTQLRQPVGVIRVNDRPMLDAVAAGSRGCAACGLLPADSLKHIQHIMHGTIPNRVDGRRQARRAG